MTKSKNAQKCPDGNTKTSGHKPTAGRVRHYPSFTYFPYDASGNLLLDSSGNIVTPHFHEELVKYLIYGLETCPTTGKYHWQGEVYFYDKVSLSMAQQILIIGKSHMENFLKLDAIASNNYCKKDGNYFEFGIAPKQGKRNDLDALKNDILSGEISVRDIVVTNPVMYHQYGRTLEKIEDIKMSKIFRTEMTKGIWLYGDTGCGKSHKAFENYNPDTHYNVPDDSGWWDNYQQQETVIINDFRGHIKYDTLLQMVDKWPFEVPRRCKPPLPFTSKTVIITSPLRPEEVYIHRMEKDNIAQLYRRFNVIEMK